MQRRQGQRDKKQVKLEERSFKVDLPILGILKTWWRKFGNGTIRHALQRQVQTRLKTQVNKNILNIETF